MVKFISGDKLFDIDFFYYYFFYVYNFLISRYSRRRNVKLLFLNVKKYIEFRLNFRGEKYILT